MTGAGTIGDDRHHDEDPGRGLLTETGTGSEDVLMGLRREMEMQVPMETIRWSMMKRSVRLTMSVAMMLM